MAMDGGANDLQGRPADEYNKSWPQIHEGVHVEGSKK